VTCVGSSIGPWLFFVAIVLIVAGVAGYKKKDEITERLSELRKPRLPA